MDWTGTMMKAVKHAVYEELMRSGNTIALREDPEVQTELVHKYEDEFSQGVLTKLVMVYKLFDGLTVDEPNEEVFKARAIHNTYYPELVALYEHKFINRMLLERMKP